MQPSTSLIMEKLEVYPSWACTAEAASLFSVLYNRGISPLFVTEERIADGTETLGEFGVLITPHASYLDHRVSAKLLAWIKKGGTLIAVGPIGLHDEYGKDDMALLKETLGDVKVNLAGKDAPIECAPTDDGGKDHLPLPLQNVPGNRWTGWHYDIKLGPEAAKRAKTLVSLKDGPGVLEAPYGEGCLVMSAFSLAKVPAAKDKACEALWNSQDNNQDWNGFLADRVERDVAKRLGGLPARLLEGRGVGLVLREGPGGLRYLAALNQRSDASQKIALAVRGSYTVTELTLGKDGMAVPALVAAGDTRFSSFLAPGEGVLFKLAPLP